MLGAGLYNLGEKAMLAQQIGQVIQQSPWTRSPEERDPSYFRTWQRVSIALQKSFRQRALEIYFHDPSRLQDHETACTMIVFAASRPCYGRPRCDFTYDVADPWTLYSAWRSLGNSVRCVLAPIEKRLRDAGEVALARRYGAVWHEDVLVAVKQHPRPFIRMIAMEARLVEAVIYMGTRRNEAAAIRFHHIALNALGSFYGDDMTELIPCLMEEATRVLAADFVSRSNHLVYAGIAQHGHARAAGSPDFGIGGQENGDHRSPHSRGKVADSRIVSQVDAGGREPASEVV
jgi:hypothetical protein